MFCPKCGTNSNEDAVYCVKCGNKIATENNTIQSNNGNAKSSNNTKAFIIILLVVIFCILGQVIFLATKNNGSSDNPNISDNSTSSSNNTAIDSGTSVEENYFFTGIYTKSGYEDRAGWTGGIRDYRKYCVEFSADGTAVWWENAIYGSPRYYIGSYSYNKENDYFLLKLEDYSAKSLIVYLEKNQITIKGGKFDNVVFSKGNYKDISEAINDDENNKSSVSTTPTEITTQSSPYDSENIIPDKNDIDSIIDLMLGSDSNSAKSILENAYQGSKYVMSYDGRYDSNEQLSTIKANGAINEFSIDWDFCILRSYKTSVSNNCYGVQYCYGNDDYGNGKNHSNKEAKKLYEDLLSIAYDKYGEPDETDLSSDDESYFYLTRWYNYKGKNITLHYGFSNENSWAPFFYLLFEDN